MNKKLLFIVSEDWYFYSHRFDLAKDAIKSGYKVILVCHGFSKKKYIESAGIKFISVRNFNRSSLNLFKDIILFFSILNILRIEKPNIIHNVGLKPIIYGSLCALVCNIKNVVNAMGGLGYVFTSNKISIKIIKYLVVIFLKIIFRILKPRVILQNLEDYNCFINNSLICRERLYLIPGVGVDIDKFKFTKIPTGIPIVLLASRMLWSKGVSEFVEAAKLLRSKNLNVRFILLGSPDSGNPSSIPIDFLKNLNKNYIEWWGYSNDIYIELKKSTVVCLPSYYGEGIPKILLEAMSTGRPIITTNMPGCKELVLNKNGLLVSPKSVQDLANAVEYLIFNRNIIDEMGLKGRKIVEQEYSVKEINKQVLRIYQEYYN
jgi:glycosyltransferase involved in cell wall biosynthesis